MIPKLPDKASMEFEKELGLVFPDTEPEVREIPVEKRPIGKAKINVCEPYIGNLEKKYIRNVVESGWVSSLGPEVKKFEKEYADVMEVNYAISCTSGTSALHLCLAAFGIGPGDEVITPTFTMIASTNAIIYCGATPVLVDADDHLNIDVNKIENKITKKTKVIMPVHIYGFPCELNKIVEIANKYNLLIVEDVAESHCAYYKGKMVGGFGDISAYSMYANKLLTTGEGGMITTNDEEVAERVRTLMNHAFSPERHFCHRLLGFNYRMTALQAALGRAQLLKLKEMIEKRIMMRNAYIRNLEGEKHIIVINHPHESDISPTCWMFGVMLTPRDGVKKNLVRKMLADKGIETRNFFVPMHLQPVHYERFKGQRYPRAEEYMEVGFYLPSATEITMSEIDYISENLIKIVNKVYGEEE